MTSHISEINDYLLWSTINLFFGFGVFGIVPLVLSMICRNNKRTNNVIEAESMSTLALFFNLVITIGGIIGWTVFIIYVTVYRIALQSLV